MIVGTCSLCGGAVQVPDVWMGIIPPVPTCLSCGATRADRHGPVIPMTPSMPPTISGPGFRYVYVGREPTTYHVPSVFVDRVEKSTSEWVCVPGPYAGTVAPVVPTPTEPKS